MKLKSLQIYDKSQHAGEKIIHLHEKEFYNTCLATLDKAL